MRGSNTTNITYLTSKVMIGGLHNVSGEDLTKP